MKKFIFFILLFLSSISYGQNIGDTDTPYSTTGWDTPEDTTIHYGLPIYRLLSNPGGWINISQRQVDSLLWALIVYTKLPLYIENDTLKVDTTGFGTLLGDSVITWSKLSVAVRDSIRDIPLGSDILYVSSQIVANGVDRFNTVASAISIWSTGKTILLAGETFNEDVILSDSLMVLQGISKEATKIKSLTISGKKCKVSDLTINSTYNYLCTATLDIWSGVEAKEPTLYNVKLMGSVNLGTATIKATYYSTMEDCNFLGADSLIYVNGVDPDAEGESKDHPFVLHNCYIDSLDFTLRSGKLLMYHCPRIVVDTVYQMNATAWSLFEIRNCPAAYILGAYKTDNSTNHWACFGIRNSDIYMQRLSPLTLSGKNEFDIMNCSWAACSIVYNTVIASSRIINTSVIGYQNSATISGSDLENLYIYNSVFYSDAPVGLGADRNNCWKAFVDN